ncbi:MAG TPA: SET domain-containing protein [Flavitalea sp.]|nr:SET domain-containing protein [Flavitalea sp.]
MALLENQLVIKRSTIPGSGKGLFTKKEIPKNSKIVEYKGRVSSWKEADHRNGENGYVYYIKRDHVVDALPFKNALARYANDAKGLCRVKGINNNSEYVEEGLKVFIVSRKKIPKNGEILVAYGKEYWEVIKQNRQLQNQK